MHLIQLLLPLYSNSGRRFEHELYSEVRNELIDRFGGITAYTRAPVHGLWQDSEQVVRETLIIYEIMVQDLDEKWWCEYRIILENRFQQDSLVMRAHKIQFLYALI